MEQTGFLAAQNYNLHEIAVEPKVEILFYSVHERGFIHPPPPPLFRSLYYILDFYYVLC